MIQYILISVLSVSLGVFSVSADGDPDPHLPALPLLRQVTKAMNRYIPSPTALSVSLGKYTVSAVEIQTLTYQLCDSYARY